MQSCSYANTLAALPASQFETLVAMNPDFTKYVRECTLTMNIKFMLADEVLCSLSQANDYAYTEGDANLYDLDEREKVIELINSWIYQARYGE